MESVSQRTAEASPPKSPRSSSPKNKPDAEELKKAEETRKKALRSIKNRSKKASLTNYSYHIVIGGFILICVIALISVFFGGSKKLSLLPVIDDEDIATLNSNEYGFTVGSNEFFQGWTLADAKYIINNQLSSKSSLARCMTLEDTSIIPERYNTREMVPECARPIFNQQNCSSSYSIAAVSALSDRFCIQTKAAVKPDLSAQVALSCDSKKNYGCKGGSVTAVFDYGRKQGLVDSSCLVYSGSDDTQCETANCAKYYVGDYCVSSGEEGIKREIFKNGPVIAVIPIYKDFLIYKEGIYQIIEGTSKFHGGHAVKIIGWDKTENGQGYWILENSWGESWGKNGIGYVAIGQKNLYIDEFVIAAQPKTDKQNEAEPVQPLGENVEAAENQDLDA